ncbi:MAG: hypothetical protein Q8S84_06280 [bacterium]|nr:hypothetical protein [bacterium]MDP3381081.1 hypothetical protein [bacterium]
MYLVLSKSLIFISVNLVSLLTVSDTKSKSLIYLSVFLFFEFSTLKLETIESYDSLIFLVISHELSHSLLDKLDTHSGVSNLFFHSFTHCLTHSYHFHTNSDHLVNKSQINLSHHKYAHQKIHANLQYHDDIPGIFSNSGILLNAQNMNATNQTNFNSQL